MVRWAVLFMRAFQILMSPFGVEVVCGAPRLVCGFGASEVVRKLCPALRGWNLCIVFLILYLGGAGCFAGRIMSPNFQSRGEGLARVFRATSWLVRAP